ncbi:polyketide synthase dehydratase domain-containing protein, partial [Actinoplanes sp. GCM10030250]|uniref:polyketide synthase dehydratase domain-containing protein n=1 Tax=Actinoplanes sp. GCM10030250 TaxID=3273376 RepID=UPI0036177BEC
VESAGTGEVLFTGSVSRKAFGWLADHVVQDIVLLPGTAMVDWALTAGQHLGCPHLAELTLEAPLTLPERGAVTVQVAVGPDGEDGRRPVTLSSRHAGEPWTRHATGSLAPAVTAPAEAPPTWPPAGALSTWPPAGADEVPGLYADLTGRGYGYGPAFQGAQRVWRRGDEVFSEVVVPEAARGAGFTVHPVLLDAALHGAGAGLSGDQPALVPFAFHGVTVPGSCPDNVRVRLRRTGEQSVEVLLFTADRVVAVIEQLVVRAVSANALRQAAVRDALFEVVWEELAASVERLAPGSVV